MTSTLQKICILAGIMLFVNFEGTSALLCYHCNSEYDPRCGDPFDPYSLGKVNCSKQDIPEHLHDVSSTLCRKIIQKVYGKVRVFRGCGYLPDENDNQMCVKRSGTHDVQAIYCACTNDLCNGAQKTLMIDNNLFRALPLALIVLLQFLTNHYNRMLNIL